MKNEEEIEKEEIPPKAACKETEKKCSKGDCMKKSTLLKALHWGSFSESVRNLPRTSAALPGTQMFPGSDNFKRSCYVGVPCFADYWLFVLGTAISTLEDLDYADDVALLSHSKLDSCGKQVCLKTNTKTSLWCPWAPPARHKSSYRGIKILTLRRKLSGIPIGGVNVHCWSNCCGHQGCHWARDAFAEPRPMCKPGKYSR